MDIRKKIQTVLWYILCFRMFILNVNFGFKPVLKEVLNIRVYHILFYRNILCHIIFYYVENNLNIEHDFSIVFILIGNVNTNIRIHTVYLYLLIINDL